MSPEDPRHGTTRGYHAGCRDLCCRRARARYEKEGRLARLRGGRAVLALGAQRRIRALMVLGWSSEDIANEAGWSHRNYVLRILNGQKGKPCTWLERGTDEKIRAVYERLSMRVPEMDPYRRRSITIALRKGWAPPLAWDNIDTDLEPWTPEHQGRGRPASLPAQIEEYDFLIQQGESEEQVLARLGIKRRENFIDQRTRYLREVG